MIGSPALAQEARVSIPATTLDVAVTLLARETGADIISTEAGLRGVRVRGVQGTMRAGEALRRMLNGTGYRAIAIDARSFRIVRAARPAPVTAKAAPPAPGVQPQSDVVVTASKQRISLLRYPGTLTRVDDAVAASPAASALDMSRISQNVPILQNTEFGPGRNKIFIRGIADSSFTGAAQSTATIYFGDVQLGYSGADPSMRLYDMQSVEVMEGPQGTLYGSGSVGGIIRLTPNPVDLSEAAGWIAGGVSQTAQGAPGGDLAGTVNLPVVRGVIGIRATAYRVRDGGYIDDPGRGLHDIDRTDTTGGRAAVRADPGEGWSVELGGLYQRIAARDASYADRRIGALARASTIAQPFRNEVSLGRLVLTKDWDSGLQFLSATSIAGYHTDDSFDATSAAAGAVAAPILYRTRGAKTLLTQEARLSRSLDNGGSWVAGFALLRDRDIQSRVLGPAGDPTEIIGVTNLTRSASAFGETTIAMSPRLAVTIGARLTTARTDGEPSARPRSNNYVKGRSTNRLDPTIAFSRVLGPGLALFGRYQSGYRTGGLSVASGVGRVADFRSDSIRVFELGLRRLRTGPTGLALSATVSAARWRDIQADLVSRRGYPYTANIGNAKLQAIEATADWILVPGLSADASVLYLRNQLSGVLADASSPVNRRLPETPSFAGSARLAYRWRVDSDAALRVGASLSYVGRSVLGAGDLLDISQGRYAVLGLNGGWQWRAVEATLAVENLGNARGNRFASGNPFSFAARDETTPVRPLTVRLGLAVAL